MKFPAGGFIFPRVYTARKSSRLPKTFKAAAMPSMRVLCRISVSRFTSCGVVFKRLASSAGRISCRIISFKSRILAERLAGNSTKLSAFTAESHGRSNAQQFRRNCANKSSQAGSRGLLSGPAPMNDDSIPASIRVRKPRPGTPSRVAGWGRVPCFAQRNRADRNGPSLFSATTLAKLFRLK